MKDEIERHRKAETEYLSYQRSLSSNRLARRESWQRSLRVLRPQLDPSPALSQAVDVLARRFGELANGAVTLDQLNDADRKFSDQLSRLAQISNDLKISKSKAFEALKTLAASAEKTGIREEVAAILENRRIAIEPLGTVVEVETVVADTTAEVQTLLREHHRLVRERRARELRFEPNLENSSSKILEALAELVPTADWSGKRSLFEIMETDPEIRDFMQAELQLVRRLKQAGAPEEIAGLRMENDIRLVTGVSTVMLKQLRRSLRTLNHPQTLKGLVAEGQVRRLSLLEREKVLHDALAHEPLKLTILNAGLDLPASVTPPGLPKEPDRNPPSMPDVPRKARSKSHAYQIKADIEQYKRDVENWKRAWENYKASVQLYKSQDLPKYLEQATRVRGSQARRQAARQAYVTYLSVAQPQVFADGSAKAVAGERLAWARERLQEVRDPQVKARLTEDSRRAETQASNDWLFFWYFYFVLLNPGYESNPAQAYEVYLHDAGLVTPGDLVLGAVVDAASVGGEFQMPELKLPDVQMSDVQVPDVQVPDISIPEIHVPDVQIPDPPSPPSDFSSGGGYSSGGFD